MTGVGPRLEVRVPVLYLRLDALEIVGTSHREHIC